MVERRWLCFLMLTSFVVSMLTAFGKICRFTHGAVRGKAT
jgi:hypothetical protein